MVAKENIINLIQTSNTFLSISSYLLCGNFPIIQFTNGGDIQAVVCDGLCLGKYNEYKVK